MTKLFVRAIDSEAPGSYRDRARLFAIVEKLEQAKTSSDPYLTAQAFRLIEEALMPRLSTDDGTPVNDVLDRLSARDFDALLSGLMSSSSEETVPPEKASS
ncbi:MAG: hypothetical protein Q7O66_22145 [Dehalococcoidia bacterium]|nr:hypothetical protein [Dehalococcoidia bacterium]